MIPQNTVKDLISRHSNLEKELSSGQLEKKKFAENQKSIQTLMKLLN